MTYNPETYKEKIINKFVLISEKYHKMSLLFYELSQSLKIEAKKTGSLKDFREHIKELGLDIRKIEGLSQSIKNISLDDLKGGI